MEFKKHAVILAVIEHLRANGSWTGKTHVQKSLFLINETSNPRIPFDFVLYKHGPYSFDVETELEQMKSYAAVKAEPVSGYGVVLKPDMNAELVKQMAKLTDNEARHIADVCRFVGGMGVTDLEKVATSAWVRNRENIVDPKQVALRVNELKPHISLEEASNADNLLIQSLTLVA